MLLQRESYAFTNGWQSLYKLNPKKTFLYTSSIVWLLSFYDNTGILYFAYNNRKIYGVTLNDYKRK